MLDIDLDIIRNMDEEMDSDVVADESSDREAVTVA